MGKQAESISISVETRHVRPEFFRHQAFQGNAFSLSEIGLNSFFARMSERRIAQVVSQTGSRDYCTNLLKQRRAQLWMNFAQATCHVIAQRHTNRSHLERVSQTVMNENAARQRKHLSLVLQTAEWSRENQSVVIALKLRPVVITVGMSVLLP